MARMNQHDANVFRLDARVIAAGSAHEVIEFGQRLDSGEASAGDDQRQQLAPPSGVGFQIRVFELVDDMRVQSGGIRETFDRQRVLGDAGYTVNVAITLPRDELNASCGSIIEGF